MTSPKYRILGFIDNLKIVKEKGKPQTTLRVEEV